MSPNLKFAGTTETRPSRGKVGGIVKTTYRFIGKPTNKTYVRLLVVPADPELREKILHYTINPKNMKLEATKHTTFNKSSLFPVNTKQLADFQ